MKNSTINIVLAADLNFSEQLTTLIKSICYHHRNVRFYLIHKQFTNEWFEVLNKKLAVLDSEIISARIVDLEDFSHLIKTNNFTESICYRYLIPEIQEERVLYLDADIVVDGKIDELYFSDFNGKLLLAVKDCFINDIEYSPNIRPYFNSGVMLINNDLWRKLNITEKLLSITRRLNETVLLDQDALNIVLAGQWNEIAPIYNYQTGILNLVFESKVLKNSLLTQMSADELWEYYQQEIREISPKIIHYTTEFKPWKNSNTDVLLKEKYWFYYQLDWEDIYKNHIKE